jgi:hypothetical protein
MGASDFDFWIGRWHIRHERLQERLRGSTEWIAFDGSVEAHALPAGFGNIDHCAGLGLTVRLYDPARDRWSIYWAANGRGAFDPPVVGGFSDGVGIFEGEDMHDATPVRVRFVWTHPTPATARWEQSFSPDGGATWETNWIMHFTRAD